MKLLYLIRKFLAKIQNFAKSAEVHGSSYSAELAGKSTVESEMHENLNLSFSELGSGYLEIIEKFSNEFKVAIDIGAGTGWLSKFLSRYFETVISVEPTEDGIKLGKQLLLEKESYVKNLYLKQKAEDFLEIASLVSPALVFFQTVLSHLPNKQVELILSKFDGALPIGSKVVFSEVYGDPYEEVMWFVRPPSWWESKLPNWKFDFFGPKLPERTESKGFVATRIR